MTNPAELPPVPEPKGTRTKLGVCDGTNGSLIGGERLGQWMVQGREPSGDFTAEQMRAYGLACALAERERAEKDALRYRFLRELHWSDGPMCVAMQPKLSVKLGHDCPSHERLDDAIDAAIRARGEVK
jgi:hypothetical protein